MCRAVRWRAPVTSFWSPCVSSSRSPAPVRSSGPSVVLSDLSFSWPNGRGVLDGLNAAFSPGRTGLIGVNGAGKSTLLALIAGRLRPSSGSVTVTGDVGYLPQSLTLDADARVASLLGIAGVLDAIDAIEAGDASEAAFDAVGDAGTCGSRPRRGCPGSAWTTSASTTRLAGCPAARRS